MHEEKALVGSCGLYCGLCPRYQSKAPSRCPGCQLGGQHSYCSVYRCVTKRGFTTCAECSEYPCERLLRVVGVEKGLDSFVSHKPALPNLDEIKQDGLDSFLQEQRKRRLLAEHLISNYNAGRSMTLYCTACVLMPPRAIDRAINKMKKLLTNGQVDRSNQKEVAKAMRKLIQGLASELSIDLALRRR